MPETPGLPAGADGGETAAAEEVTVENSAAVETAETGQVGPARERIQINVRLREKDIRRLDRVTVHYSLGISALIRMLLKREADALRKAALKEGPMLMMREEDEDD